MRTTATSMRAAILYTSSALLINNDRIFGVVYGMLATTLRSLSVENSYPDVSSLVLPFSLAYLSTLVNVGTFAAISIAAPVVLTVANHFLGENELPRAQRVLPEFMDNAGKAFISCNVGALAGAASDTVPLLKDINANLSPFGIGLNVALNLAMLICYSIIRDYRFNEDRPANLVGVNLGPLLVMACSQLLSRLCSDSFNSFNTLQLILFLSLPASVGFSPLTKKFTRYFNHCYANCFGRNLRANYQPVQNNDASANPAVALAHS